MSEPKLAEAVKLFAGLLISDKDELRLVLESLVGEYGLVDFVSPIKPFTYTDYYCPEMGDRMERMFVSFAALMRPELLPDVKLRTNALEKVFSRLEGRKVNIDPGYISSAHIILATGKGYAHRPYLRDGIYADLTLVYGHKSFQTLPWTYPDYGEQETREMFKTIRTKYMAQLKNTRARGRHNG